MELSQAESTGNPGPRVELGTQLAVTALMAATACTHGQGTLLPASKASAVDRKAGWESGGLSRAPGSLLPLTQPPCGSSDHLQGRPGCLHEAPLHEAGERRLGTVAQGGSHVPHCWAHAADRDTGPSWPRCCARAPSLLWLQGWEPPHSPSNTDHTAWVALLWAGAGFPGTPALARRDAEGRRGPQRPEPEPSAHLCRRST